MYDYTRVNIRTTNNVSASMLCLNQMVMFMVVDLAVRAAFRVLCFIGVKQRIVIKGSHR